MPDSAAALAVLVLAWDEAAPTVRTVVGAAPAVGSLLVLLPPALPAPAPIKARLTPPISEQPTVALTAPVTVVAASVAAAASPTLPPAGPAPAASTPAETVVPALGPLAPEKAISAAPAAQPSQLATPAVRVLHVVASQLPATRRSNSFQVPAAPYLAATAPPVLPAPTATTNYPTQTVTTLSSLEPGTAPSPNPLQNSNLRDDNAITTALETADMADVISAAAPLQYAEATAPAPVAATAPAAPAAAEALGFSLAEAAFAAAEILDPNPEEELRPTSQQLTAAASPADALQLSDLAPGSASLSLGPFGNRLPQFATAAPPVPRPLARAVAADDPEDTPDERARGFAASVAAARQYTAPDLNSQVIRYARLAVPMALAEGPYEVIYAPAWPTWLAAMELRQRTPGPLVLHLPALAAGRQSADTAAGWPAELQRQALRQADLVLVETYALARRLRRELGLGPTTVRVVPTADAAAVARALRRVRRRPGLA